MTFVPLDIEEYIPFHEMPASQHPVPELFGHEPVELAHEPQQSYNPIVHPTLGHDIDWTGPISSGVSVENSSLMVPDLSPETASRRSSFSSAGGFSTSIQQNNTSFYVAESAGGSFAALGGHWEAGGAPVDGQYVDQPFSSTAYPSNGFETSVPNENLLSSQNLAEWTRVVTVSPSNPQRGLHSLPHLPAVEEQPYTNVYIPTGASDLQAQFRGIHIGMLPANFQAADNADYQAIAVSAQAHQPVYSCIDDQGYASTKPSTTSTAEEVYLPVKCEQCSKVYTGQYGLGNMRRHVSLTHVGKSYECRGCEKSYKRSDARRGHERKKHPNLDIISSTRRAAA